MQTTGPPGAQAPAPAQPQAGAGTTTMMMTSSSTPTQQAPAPGPGSLGNLGPGGGSGSGGGGSGVGGVGGGAGMSQQLLALKLQASRVRDNVGTIRLDTDPWKDLADRYVLFSGQLHGLTEHLKKLPQNLALYPDKIFQEPGYLPNLLATKALPEVEADERKFLEEIEANEELRLLTLEQLQERLTEYNDMCGRLDNFFNSERENYIIKPKREAETDVSANGPAIDTFLDALISGKGVQSSRGPEPLLPITSTTAIPSASGTLCPIPDTPRQPGGPYVSTTRVMGPGMNLPGAGRGLVARPGGILAPNAVGPGSIATSQFHLVMPPGGTAAATTAGSASATGAGGGAGGAGGGGATGPIPINPALRQAMARNVGNLRAVSVGQRPPGAAAPATAGAGSPAASAAAAAAAARGRGAPTPGNVPAGAGRAVAMPGRGGGTAMPAGAGGAGRGGAAGGATAPGAAQPMSASGIGGIIGLPAGTFHANHGNYIVGQGQGKLVAGPASVQQLQQMQQQQQLMLQQQQQQLQQMLMQQGQPKLG